MRRVMDVVRPGRRAAMGSALAVGGWLASGAPLAWAAPGRRVVSVGGALTEIAYALEASGDLVGVDSTSLYPSAATKLPNVGYARTLSAEGILALAPTHIVATEDAGPPAVMRQLAAAGVSLSVLAAHHRFEGLLERVDRMGVLLGRPAQARQLSARLQAEWASARQAVARRTESARGAVPRVLFVLSHSPSQVMVAGQETSAQAMIDYVGARNAVEGMTGYKPLTSEAVVVSRPDVVLFTDQGLQALGGVDGALKLPGLAQTPAGRVGRVLSQEAMFLLGFGPRLPAALAALDGTLRKALST